MTDTCSNCRFFVAEKSLCRRYPPIPMQIMKLSPLGQPETQMVGQLPATSPTYWCGEHHAIEN